jgi:hypothetical protein
VLQADAECDELEAAVAALKAQLAAAEDALHAAEAAAAEAAAEAEARCEGRARARARGVAGLRLRAPARTRWGRGEARGGEDAVRPRRGRGKDAVRR